MIRILFFFVPAMVTLTAVAQTPAPPPATTPNRPSTGTEASKIDRFLAGPGNRPQGFLLHSGTLVILPPGLSQRVPSTMTKNAAVRVTGDEFSYDGSRTIHAKRLVLDGVTYEDTPPAPPMAPPPPPPPAASAPPPPPAHPATPAPPSPSK